MHPSLATLHNFLCKCSSTDPPLWLFQSTKHPAPPSLAPPKRHNRTSFLYVARLTINSPLLLLRSTWSLSLLYQRCEPALQLQRQQLLSLPQVSQPSHGSTPGFPAEPVPEILQEQHKIDCIKGEDKTQTCISYDQSTLVTFIQSSKRKYCICFVTLWFMWECHQATQSRL